MIQEPPQVIKYIFTQSLMFGFEVIVLRTLIILFNTRLICSVCVLYALTSSYDLISVSFAVYVILLMADHVYCVLHTAPLDS